MKHLIEEYIRAFIVCIIVAIGIGIYYGIKHSSFWEGIGVSIVVIVTAGAALGFGIVLDSHDGNFK